MRRTLPGAAGIDKIVASKNGYVVTLNLHASTSVADIVRRVELNSTLITEMDLVDEAIPAGARIRVARLQVRVD